MFSFHKPRVYRSAEGCCICRAKSSSSRFTDSKKYEDDSMKCFNLDKPRKGEICNACVLLVKRFKRLPVGSNRHWGHVVDARIGPGLKSMSKFKKIKDENGSQQVSTDNRSKLQNGKVSSSIPEKFCKIFKKNKKKNVTREKGKKVKEKCDGSSRIPWDEQLFPPTPESFNSDCEENQYSNNHIISASSSLKMINKMNRRKLQKPKRITSNRNELYGNFFDENDWKPLKSCCGMVFENKQYGALIIDIQSYKPCPEHKMSLLKDSTNHQIIHSNNKNVHLLQINSDSQKQQQQHHIRKTHFIVTENTEKFIKEEKQQQQQQQQIFPALKKHHLFFKRQMENFPRTTLSSSSDNLIATTATSNLMKTDLESTSTTITANIVNNNSKTNLKLSRENEIEINSKTKTSAIMTTTISTMPSATITTTSPTTTTIGGNNYKFKTLHQIRSDTGRIIKHSIDKINMLCVKQADLNEVKGLVKFTDKTLKSKFCAKLKVSDATTTTISTIATPTIHNKNVDPSNTKFSDNSSDSGFDENMLERKSSSPPGGDEDKKILIQPVQTMFLASGVQICGQQQNLILTGNDVAARMLQQRQQQSQINIHTGTKAAQTTTLNGCPTKVSAIFNQTADGGLITLSNGTNLSTMTASLTPSAAATLNQKIILVKAKYNNTKPSTTN